jgi:hypothetical protein
MSPLPTAVLSPVQYDSPNPNRMDFILNFPPSTRQPLTMRQLYFMFSYTARESFSRPNTYFFSSAEFQSG